MSCSGEPASPKDPDTTREESLIFNSWGSIRPVDTHPNPEVRLPQMWKICKFFNNWGQNRPVETHPNPEVRLPQMWKICCCFFFFTSWGQNRPVETHPNPEVRLPQMWKIYKFLTAGGQSPSVDTPEPGGPTTTDVEDLFFFFFFYQLGAKPPSGDAPTHQSPEALFPLVDRSSPGEPRKKI